MSLTDCSGNRGRLKQVVVNRLPKHRRSVAFVVPTLVALFSDMLRASPGQAPCCRREEAECRLGITQKRRRVTGITLLEGGRNAARNYSYRCASRGAYAARGSGRCHRPRGFAVHRPERLRADESSRCGCDSTLVWRK